MAVGLLFALPFFVWRGEERTSQRWERCPLSVAVYVYISSGMTEREERGVRKKAFQKNRGSAAAALGVANQRRRHTGQLPSSALWPSASASSLYYREVVHLLPQFLPHYCPSEAAAAAAAEGDKKRTQPSDRSGHKGSLFPPPRTWTRVPYYHILLRAHEKKTETLDHPFKCQQQVRERKVRKKWKR